MTIRLDRRNTNVRQDVVVMPGNEWAGRELYFPPPAQPPSAPSLSCRRNGCILNMSWTGVNGDGMSLAYHESAITGLKCAGQGWAACKPASDLGGAARYLTQLSRRATSILCFSIRMLHRAVINQRL